MTGTALVCGLAAEARIAARAGLRVACAGSAPERAATLARQLAAEGVSALVSFGVAGGLDPALGPGDLVIAAEVVAGRERLVVPEAWRDRVAARLPGARIARVAGASAPVATIEAKRALRLATGAIAVDLESEAVARAALAAGLPFLAVRAVADPANRVLPPEAARWIRDDGGIAAPRVALAAVARPSLLPCLVRLASDMRRAIGSLGLAATALRSEPPP